MSIYSSKKVLIVDDEPDVRTYLKSALEDYGFNVKTASDGFDALEQLENFTPDIISLDLVMPRHSGIKFYRDLKKRKEWSKIPVLIVTGHARDDLGKADFDAMIMQGPGVYLEKPVKPNNYVATICQMLGIESPVKIQEDTELNTEQLREELLKNLSTADTEALQKALDALKKG
jgi:CheY-like chemotaxis protein